MDGYQSADWNRYNQDFTTTLYSPNQLISREAKDLRARAQWLERNSDHVRRFLALIESNVVGPHGIKLQSRATRSSQTDTPDRPAMRLIERQWQDWTEMASVDGMHWVDLLKLVVRRLVVDGEAFVELLPGFDNPQRYAVRIWPAEAVPLGMSDEDRGVQFGIERDGYGRARSYYVHPSGGAPVYGTYEPSDYIRIPADRMLHLYRPERPMQRRGITMLCSTSERVKMLANFERATLIGAQIAASKMGFFRDPEGMELSQYSGDGTEGNDTETNIVDIQAGQFEDIGHKVFEAFDPAYPPAEYDQYVHEILRAAASGLNISYHVLANDPSSVNYSTAREFRLQDTDSWRDWQHWVIRHLCTPTVRNWLRVQMLRPPLDRYRPEDYARLSQVRWQPRGWQWVDPQKEGNGNLLALQMGVKSPTEIAAEQGRDFDETVLQIERDKQFAAEHGVSLGEVYPIEDDEDDEQV